MNKKILAAAVAATLMVPAIVSADGLTDNQEIRITVPEIAMIDMADTAVVFDMTTTAPTEAGQTFGLVTQTSSYSISANIDKTETARKLTVGLDATKANIPPGGKLTIGFAAPANSTDTPAVVVATAPTFTNNTHTPTPSTTAQDVLTSIGNVASGATPLTINYTFEPETAGGMISFSETNGTAADIIGLVYTLSDDAN